VRTPAPLRTGAPGCGYPWRWSVTPWIPGVAAEGAPLAADQAAAMGRFLKRLHRPAPGDAPFNPYRSLPLSERAATSEPPLRRLAESRPELIDGRLLAAWEAAKATEIDLPAGWIHGDLHARNVITDQGRLSGVIDWGDMARGDPATDLYGLWMLFPDPAARAEALTAYGGISEATRRRAHGWGIAIGAVIVEAGAQDDPGLMAMGETVLRAVRAELA
jgi:aminoglycoside phosphotransferase (APT) family kinase protein